MVKEDVVSIMPRERARAGNTQKKLDYFEKLGAKIKQLREAKGLDQKAFAFDCGIGRTQLYMIESGKTNPRLLTLMKIADGLGVTVDTLLRTA